jgi:hypothetical protein
MVLPMHHLAGQHRRLDLVEFHIGGEPTTPSSRWSRGNLSVVENSVDGTVTHWGSPGNGASDRPHGSGT